jgi:organic hydroperoxide reductase OsmC/OhrA
MVVASPPEFKGPPGVWTPEHLFVAAVNICTMTTFIAFARHKKIPVVSYESHAEGMLEFVDSGYQFTRVALQPRVIVSDAAHVEQALATLQDAHNACLVSNSIKSEVLLEPQVESPSES